MGSSRVSELQDFTGGMNTVVAPHLISIREAIQLVNVDIRKGTLHSMPNLDYLQKLDNQYFYQFNDFIFSYSNYRSNIEWDNKYYWSDGVSTGKVLDDGTELPLGLPTPSVALTQGVGGAGVHEGDFKYTYTFYSSTTGAESAPAPLPLYIKPNAQSVNLSGFQALPTNADTYRLYRVGGYLPVFLMVDSFTTVGTYNDNIDDSKIDGRPLYTLRNGAPPSGLENLIELNGRFYGSVGNKVYYSALGNPDAWYVSDYFLMRDVVVGMAAVPAGLIVMGVYYTSLLQGRDISNFRLKLLSDHLGCVGKESIAYIGDSAVWLSNTQFVMSNGYKITDITAFKIDRISGMFPTGACSNNETYYVSYRPTLVPKEELYPSDKLYPDSAVGTSEVGQGIVAIDFKRGNSFSYKIIRYDNIRYIDIVNTDVHVCTGDYGDDISCDNVMYSDCLSFTKCSPFSLNIMSIYGDQGRARLNYESGFLTEGSIATLKQYDKVRIQFIGTFNIKILFDNGEIIIDKDIVSEGIDTERIIGIPNKNNLAYGLTFKIEGVGTVYSIQYSWQPRELVN